MEVTKFIDNKMQYTLEKLKGNGKEQQKFVESAEQIKGQTEINVY